MSRSKKLELTWIGKEDRPRLEPRILVEDATHSHHAAARRDGDLFDNRLIQGDNLLALKALEAEFTGKVKCVFIDPPYNTGSAFEHYDDGLEHSLWLTMMRDRMELIHNLLAENGSLWVTLDDNEAHYFKVMADEIFGRANCVANIVWQKKYSKQNDAKYLSVSHDHIFLYAKNIGSFSVNKINREEEQLKGYKNPDKDYRGRWQSVVYTCSKTRAERPNLYYPIKHPRTGQEVWPNESRVWGYDQKKYAEHVAENRLWWGEKLEQEKPRLKSFLKDVGLGVVPDTLWFRADVGDNQDAKREGLVLDSTHTFATPKPESLIKRIIEVATRPGDLVLDSFAGSGTTGAVAQKMGRRWIMVELGEHATTHIVPRLRKVIDGSDVGGVTEATGWRGGGGFRFYRLAPSLLEQDRWGNWVISKKYNPAMLAEAMCKHMGFTYAPSQDPSEYWRHGQSSERDFIFVTTHALTHEMLSAISYDVGPDRHLLVCCKAFSSKRTSGFENLTLTRIPHVILDTCEWGRDDYSLKIAHLPEETRDDRTPEPPARGSVLRGREQHADHAVDQGLFDQPADAEG